MSKAEELAAKMLWDTYPEDRDYRPDVLVVFRQYLEQYGRLVQEAAAKKADAEIDIEWPNDAISVRAKIIGKSIRFMELP